MFKFLSELAALCLDLFDGTRNESRLGPGRPNFLEHVEEWIADGQLGRRLALPLTSFSSS